MYGEENCEFTNTLGETITVQMMNKTQETAELLSKVLDGNQLAAMSLAEAAHECTDEFTQQNKLSSQDCEVIDKVNLDIENVGIWIDPIDGTSQYVGGKDEYTTKDIQVNGLPCVTVLIGAYHIDSGLPIMGVVYQPFHDKMEDQRWNSKYYWGFSHDGVNLNNFGTDYEKNVKSRNGKIGVISSGRDDVIHKLPGMDVVKSRGAGYKALCVILGHVDCYPLTQAACYKWDTCAPHALLLSLGGGLIDLQQAITHSGSPEEIALKLDDFQLIYNKQNPSSIKAWLNQGGLLAYTTSKQSKDCVVSILKYLKNFK